MILLSPGYKMNLLKASRVNLLIAYDIKNKIPLMYRTYRGSSVDKSSVLEFLRNRSFADTKFIVNRGFFSESVLSLMSENGNCYIIPVLSNSKHFHRIKKTLAYTSGEFVYKSEKKTAPGSCTMKKRLTKRPVSSCSRTRMKTIPNVRVTCR